MRLIMANATTNQILIVEDETSIRDTLLEFFDVEGNQVTAAAELTEAVDLLRRRSFDLIVTDLRLGAKRDGGLQIIALAGMLSPDALVLVLTAFPDDASRQASQRLGALHFLEKPLDLGTLAAHASSVGVRTAFA